VSLDSAAAVQRFVDASADAASVYANRQEYERYLPLLGNVSYASRHTYWTSPVDPPSPSPETSPQRS
jgi:hypothetical protein